MSFSGDMNRSDVRKILMDTIKSDVLSPKEQRLIVLSAYMLYPDYQLSVNCNGSLQVKRSPTLKKLIKDGYLKTIRVPNQGILKCGQSVCTNYNTYLVRA